MSTTEQAARTLTDDLQDLKRMVSEMGGHVEQQFLSAITALVQHDCQKGHQVVSADTNLDALQQAIEEKSITTFENPALTVGDVRHVIAIMRIANDLERIGDLAKNIGKRVSALTAGDMSRQSRRGLTNFMRMVSNLLQDVLDGFANGDCRKAESIVQRDQEIASMYGSLYHEFRSYMVEDSETVSSAMHLLFCARNIEGVSDHATRIADATHYMVEGYPIVQKRNASDLKTANRLGH
jgi:phosphate transport system protein